MPNLAISLSLLRLALFLSRGNSTTRIGKDLNFLRDVGCEGSLLKFVLGEDTLCSNWFKTLNFSRVPRKFTCMFCGGMLITSLPKLGSYGCLSLYRNYEFHEPVSACGWMLITRIYLSLRIGARVSENVERYLPLLLPKQELWGRINSHTVTYDYLFILITMTHINHRCSSPNSKGYLTDLPAVWWDTHHRTSRIDGGSLRCQPAP